MTYFLKGNYDLSANRTVGPRKSDSQRTLTERMEDAALAKLGGSVAFVRKGKTLLWMGEPNEDTG
jgi:hypothetical protein